MGSLISLDVYKKEEVDNRKRYDDVMDRLSNIDYDAVVRVICQNESDGNIDYRLLKKSDNNMTIECFEAIKDASMILRSTNADWGK